MSSPTTHGRLFRRLPRSLAYRPSSGAGFGFGGSVGGAPAPTATSSSTLMSDHRPTPDHRQQHHGHNHSHGDKILPVSPRAWTRAEQELLVRCVLDHVQQHGPRRVGGGPPRTGRDHGGSAAGATQTTTAGTTPTQTHLPGWIDYRTQVDWRAVAAHMPFRKASQCRWMMRWLIQPPVDHLTATTYARRRPGKSTERTLLTIGSRYHRSRPSPPTPPSPPSPHAPQTPTTTTTATTTAADRLLDSLHRLDLGGAGGGGVGDHDDDGDDDDGLGDAGSSRSPTISTPSSAPTTPTTRSPIRLLGLRCRLQAAELLSPRMACPGVEWTLDEEQRLVRALRVFTDPGRHLATTSKTPRNQRPSGGGHTHSRGHGRGNSTTTTTTTPDTPTADDAHHHHHHHPDTDPTLYVEWSSISEAVATRSQQQCKQKWAEWRDRMRV